ncbi:MAG: N-(5'-phosphoribosyl)anthranilate isomerase [Paracidovorax wautersii]|uniref:N-(5'-phosphoribosyl)anthranilate isomerase n=1 Tax=Paracidovorax wautersii TaxID=1177982 RepID=A0A7V8FMH5_9BURK|nr:MAG: N-(5'-phosphoribosyl)anthranilate isomerase [Paracidovorax wautersii]
MTEALNSAPTPPVAPQRRTRVKICGLTREQDLDATVAAGADAVGFVLYAKSPRHVSAARARELALRLPPFVTPVLLLVNATPEVVAAAVAAVPWAVLQFHGDETVAQCEAAGQRYIRAARIPLGPQAPAFDLVEYATAYASAQAILADAHAASYGGTGQSFNWNAFNWSHPAIAASSRLVLSGGLTPANVTDGILQVRPWAVDVSSGVEAVDAHGQPLKGLKDPVRIERFIAAVRAADAQLAKKD